MQSYAEAGAGPRKEYWNGIVYDIDSAYMYGQLRPRSGVNMNMQINRGEQIDFANSRLADQRNFRPTVDWNATRHLLVRLRYTSDHLSTKEGATIYDAVPRHGFGPEPLRPARDSWREAARAIAHRRGQRLQALRRLLRDPGPLDARPGAHLRPLERALHHVVHCPLIAEGDGFIHVPDGLLHRRQDRERILRSSAQGNEEAWPHTLA